MAKNKRDIDAEAERIRKTATPDQMRALQRVLFPDIWALDYLGLQLDPWQVEFSRAKEQNLVLACGRQVGKSTGTAVKGTHHARYTPNSLTIMISPSDRQSGELFKTTRQMVHEAGIPVSPDDDNKRSMTLLNGARLIALPSNADTVRGFAAATMIIIDEAAFAADDILPAITPMMATTSDKAKLILLSSPNGRAGFFFEAYQGAQKAKGWRRWHVPSTDCPHIAPQYLADKRVELGEMMYKQEYLAEFVTDGLNPIDVEAFRDSVDPSMKAFRL